MEPQVHTEPLFAPQTLARVRTVVWLLSVGVYTFLLVDGIAGGGTDVLVLGKALGAALAVALLGRIGLGLLGQAQRAYIIRPQAYEQDVSLVDLLAPGSAASAGAEAQRPNSLSDQAGQAPDRASTSGLER